MRRVSARPASVLRPASVSARPASVPVRPASVPVRRVPALRRAIAAAPWIAPVAASDQALRLSLLLYWGV